MPLILFIILSSSLACHDPPYLFLFFLLLLFLLHFTLLPPALAVLLSCSSFSAIRHAPPTLLIFYSFDCSSSIVIYSRTSQLSARFVMGVNPLMGGGGELPMMQQFRSNDILFKNSLRSDFLDITSRCERVCRNSSFPLCGGSTWVDNCDWTRFKRYLLRNQHYICLLLFQFSKHHSSNFVFFPLISIEKNTSAAMNNRTVLQISFISLFQLDASDRRHSFSNEPTRFILNIAELLTINSCSYVLATEFN